MTPPSAAGGPAAGPSADGDPAPGGHDRAGTPYQPVLAAIWPARTVPPSPALVAAAAVTGLAGALVLPFRAPGLGAVAVLLSALGVGLAPVLRHRPGPRRFAWTGLAAGLVAVTAVRDAVWVSVLCLLAAVLVAAVTILNPRTVRGVVLAVPAIPTTLTRAGRWAIRLIGAPGARTWGPAVRTVAVSAAAGGLFVALFASADALFARWVDAVLPDVSLDTAPTRGLVLVALAGATLAASYSALDPPALDRLAGRGPRPVRHPFEWAAPVAAVLAAYLGFVASQLTVMFGGHDYLRRTTGLTYAEYVHRGFGQLVVTTLLTLLVIAAAFRRADRSERPQRALLRGLLGPLCLLTLVVVASALFRMHVYAEAYGLTRLRLLVAVFEGWLGLVVLLVAAAGVRLAGDWLPRAVVATGAATLLALAAVNPDGYVAARNVARYAESGRVDWFYLGSLSADAVPALRALPDDVEGCVLRAREGSAGDWLSWNLGRARAGSLTPDASAGCVGW